MMGAESKLSRFAGVGARRRNPERSRGSPSDPEDFYRTKGRFREFDQCSVPETAFGVHARAGTEPGIRELIIGGTPYVVLYRVLGRRVIISTIWHGAQTERVVKGHTGSGRDLSARRARNNGGRKAWVRMKQSSPGGGGIGDLSVLTAMEELLALSYRNGRIALHLHTVCYCFARVLCILEEASHKEGYAFT
jgi:hypothetical protein